MVRLNIIIGDLVKSIDIPLETEQLPTCPYPQVPNPVTGKCELTCTPPYVYNSTTGRCEIPEVKCNPPQTYNYITGRCENPVPPPTEGLPPIPVGTPTITAKTIQISTLRNAFRTQEIPILVTATCTNPPSLIKGEDASLLIDGKVVDTKTVIDGIVNFSYTFKEAGLHTIRIVIPRSYGCDSEGSASVQIDISAEVPSTLERLRIEREAQASIAAEIERIRKTTRETIGGI